MCIRDSIREEIEVVGAATRALVYDHRRDLLARRAGDGDATTAFGAVGPIAVAESGAVETGGESVGLWEEEENVSRLAVLVARYRELGVELTEKLHVPPCTLPP